MSKLSASLLIAFLVMSLVAAAPKKMVKPSVSRLSSKRAAKHMSKYYKTEKVEELEGKLEAGYKEYAAIDGFEFLNRAEHLKLTLEVVNPQLKHPYTEAQINNWFTALDLDNSDALTPEEFIPVTAVALLVNQEMS